MSSLVFIINGYGVPKNIYKDENYRFYLNSVFNQIWDIVTSKSIIRRKKRPSRCADDLAPSVSIIFCGGRTDCFPPHKRTEAGEMKKYFSMLMKRPEVRRVTKSWRLIEEKKSLSTLENFLNVEDILKELPITKGELTIFHEWRRRQRVRRTARLVLKGFQARCNAVDFDVSANRYIPNTLFRKKELKSYQLDLWVLENLKDRIKTYHRVYTRKMAFLRRAGGQNHVEALKAWWEKELGKLKA